MRFFGWWQDVSIARKLYFVVGIMATLLVCELATLRFAMHTLTAVRAFVGGEGLWAKAQKNAAISLELYGETKDEADFAAFLADFEVPEGDHQARLELLKPTPDQQRIRDGFVRGRIAPEDVQSMIHLLRRFYWTSYLSRAIGIWTDADGLLAQFKAAGLAYHVAVVSGDSPRAAEELLRIKDLNERLTRLQDDFSAALGDGSRWLERLVLTLLSLAVLVVESVGLTLTLRLGRSISRRLGTLTHTAMEVGKGNFSAEVELGADDEIGRLAESVVRMRGLLRDSYAGLETRVKARTEELARSRDQLDVILKGISDGITVIDGKGNFVFANEAGAKMCGAASVEEFLRTPQITFFADLEIMDEAGHPFPPEKLPSRLAFNGVENPPEVLVRFNPRRGGEERWTLLRSSPIFNEAHEVALVVSIFKDFTAHKRAEEELKFLDDTSQILAASMDYREALPHVVELAVPRFADECSIELEDEGPVASIDGEPARRAETLKFRKPSAMLSTSGSSITVPIWLLGKVVGNIVFSSVPTRRAREPQRRLAEELSRRISTAMDHARLYQLAQKAIQTRDEFLSIASHELKTPLTSLSLQIQIGQQEVGRQGIDGRLPQVLSVSRRQADRLRDLIEDLLDVSRIQTGKLSFAFEEVNLSDLARGVINRFTEPASRAGIALASKVSDAIVGVVDRTRIEQLIDNLMNNAIKYAPGAPVEVSLGRSGDEVVLSVADHGGGISKDKQQIIFDRFEQLSSGRVGGLGLGLFIVREIAEGHGGSVRVESDVGKGAKFIVTLPLTRPAEVVSRA